MTQLSHIRNPRLVSPVSFMNPPRDSLRTLPIFYNRDGYPQLIVYGALSEHGRRLGEPVLNMPRPLPEQMRPGDRLYESRLEFGPEHELLVTTRPPLDDHRFEEQKRVLRGDTLIEQLVMEALRPYFAHLSRSLMRLAPDVAAQLRPEYASRAAVDFYQRVCAFYKVFVDVPRSQRKPKKKATAAFLLRKPGFHPDGATLIAAFAMDGTMAMIWSYLLARVHTQWLFEDGFRMVEMSGPELPLRPTDLRFALDWKVEELVHIPG